MTRTIFYAVATVGFVFCATASLHQWEAGRQPGAIVPFSFGGVPLIVIALGAGALACGAVGVYLAATVDTVHGPSPKHVAESKTVAQTITGPGFSVVIELDAARIADDAFRSAVVKAVDAALAVSATKGGA